MKQGRLSRIHFMDWAAQDWRTSRIRLRSIRTRDYYLRLVYLEILFSLPENGGSIPADPDQLEDLLGIPAAIIRPRLAVLEKFSEGDADGGIVCANGRITNRRVTRELQAKRDFIEEQRQKGRMSGAARAIKPRRSKARTAAEPALNSGSTTVEPLLNGGSTAVEPIPIPTPTPSPTPFPSPSPAPAPSGSGGALALGKYPNAEAAEAAFHVFLDKYPPEGVPSAVKAEHAWAEALPLLPQLHDLLAALERHKRSDQWQRGKVHSIVRWLGDRMWTGKLGEPNTETGRYRVLGE